LPPFPALMDISTLSTNIYAASLSSVCYFTFQGKYYSPRIKIKPDLCNPA